MVWSPGSEISTVSASSQRNRQKHTNDIDQALSSDEKVSMATNNIAVIGSLNIDFITRTPRMPLPGETLSAYSFGNDLQSV